MKERPIIAILYGSSKFDNYMRIPFEHHPTKAQPTIITFGRDDLTDKVQAGEIWTHHVPWPFFTWVRFALRVHKGFDLVGAADTVDQRMPKKKVSNVIVMIGGRVRCSTLKFLLADLQAVYYLIFMIVLDVVITSGQRL